MHQHLELLVGEIDLALSRLDESETQWRPRSEESKWTIQENAEHLQLTYMSTIRLLESRIAKGRVTLAQASLVQRVSKRLMLNFGYLPRGRKAPEHATPVPPVTARTGTELCSSLRACIEQIDDLTGKGEEIFGDRPAVSHSVLGPLSMSEWRRFHLVHGRHHLKQVKSILISHSSPPDISRSGRGLHRS